MLSGIYHQNWALPRVCACHVVNQFLPPIYAVACFQFDSHRLGRGEDVLIDCWHDLNHRVNSPVVNQPNHVHRL